MKEMIQRQKDAVCSLGVVLSIKHPLFAVLVRHNEWILNHLVRNDFLVELDNRAIKTSPYESHTGNPAPRSTSLLNRILVGGYDDDDEQPRFQQAWFLGLIGGSDEVIALHPDGVQRHHGEWRESPLDGPESGLRELKKCSSAVSKRNAFITASLSFSSRFHLSLIVGCVRGETRSSRPPCHSAPDFTFHSVWAVSAAKRFHRGLFVIQLPISPFTHCGIHQLSTLEKTKLCHRPILSSLLSTSFQRIACGALACDLCHGQQRVSPFYHIPQLSHSKDSDFHNFSSLDFLMPKMTELVLTLL